MAEYSINTTHTPVGDERTTKEPDFDSHKISFEEKQRLETEN